jgi:pimeloyl-ACP methyl ester carboxylesterase
MRTLLTLACLSLVVPAFAQGPAARTPLDARVTHGFADSQGVKIHYAALGDRRNPLILMIHGFPDFWFTWRNQMEALSKDYYAVAIDQRGYNLSDKPTGLAQYDMSLLVADVVAVIGAVRSRGRWR